MTLHVHRAERSDRLATALGELLSVPLADPFATEVVAVPTRGIERWLAQSLSHRLGGGPTSPTGDGVCAGIDFPSPRRLVAAALAKGTAVDAETDPWQVHRAVWPLLDVFDEARGEPWAAPLWSYLSRGESVAAEGTAAEAGRGSRRFTTARHLAELFARYGSARPAMIDSWLAGADVDGTGAPLRRELAWQAEAFRRLRARLGVPSLSERLAAGREFLRADPASAGLPARLSLFGPTRIDPDHLQTLVTLAEHRDVHLWVSHPSPALWASVAAALDLAGGTTIGPRRVDPTVDVGRHRLLSYLGRDVRELQQTLVGSGAVVADHEITVDRSAAPDDLLHRLQADIGADRALPVAPSLTHSPADDSISLHSCHGPDRQVEVLREVLVGLLADDPTLEPRDIIVMCPDIETFAPLVSATFGLDPDPATGAARADGDVDAARAPEHPGHRLRVRLADRSLRQLNPLLALVARVLQLADQRVTASDLLDLIALPVVSRMFGFTDDDLLRLNDLVLRSGVRWGLDTDHRARFAMGAFGQNTWAAGLDRLLLGVTMAERDDHFIGTALPMDDIDSSDVDRVGRLSEVVERVEILLRRCSQSQSMAAWVETLKTVIEGLASVPSADAWQVGHAYAELADLADSDPADPTHDADTGSTVLSPAEVRALLADAFRGRASRTNFRTGTLTMCTMQPMRSVPHRVVCLLGVDDGAFPRSQAVDGDDVLAADPWVGDRDRRSEDRQLLLDAVLAAQERLVVVYSGADARTGAPRPTAVPIGELLDVLELTEASPDDRSLRSHLIVEHPLQPFDAVNFAPERRFSFDRQALHGARALLTRASTAGATQVRPASTRLDLSPYELPEVLPLSELTRFFNHPAKALLRSRAGLYRSEDEAPPDDQIPVGLDGLDEWQIGTRMLAGLVGGRELDALVGAEWRRGELPPRQLGGRVLDKVVGRVSELDAGSARLRELPVTSVDLDARIEVGGTSITVTGTATPLHGDTLVELTYSWLAPKHRLQGWLSLLALTVTDPGRPWQVACVGRGGTSVLGPVGADFARKVLADLVDLYATGLTDIVPFSAATSLEYAAIRDRDWPVDRLHEKIDKAWERDRDAAWAMFFDPDQGMAILETEPARASEQRGAPEPHRFGALAVRVWKPLLGAEDSL